MKKNIKNAESCTKINNPTFHLQMYEPNLQIEQDNQAGSNKKKSKGPNLPSCGKKTTCLNMF